MAVETGFRLEETFVAMRTFFSSASRWSKFDEAGVVAGSFVSGRFGSWSGHTIARPQRFEW